MRNVWLLGVLIGGVVAPEALWSMQLATVRGTVFDTLSRRPVRGARVAAQVSTGPGRVTTDAHGRYILDRIPPGRVVLEFHCPSRRLLGRHLRDTALVVLAGQSVTLNLDVATAHQCAEPDATSRRVLLRGIYDAAFETSRFVPCPSTDAARDQVWGAADLAEAWVTLPPALTTEARRRGLRGNGKWYVEWRGTLIGPGAYGHFGVAPYALVIDTLDVVRGSPGGVCPARSR